ncbi:hypothetical protein NN561_016947 [Cricetulus griseus]
MLICLRPTTPSQGVRERFGSPSVPSHPWTKPPAFPAPTPEIQGGRGSGEGTRVESASRRLARMRCGPCPNPIQRRCSRTCIRAEVLQSAGRAAPVAAHPRAWVSAPSASLSYSAGAGEISATPHPPRALSLLGVSAAASETRRRL